MFAAALASDIRTGQMRAWTFLTLHARVLLTIDGNPDVRLRDIATRVGITECAAQAIVADF